MDARGEKGRVSAVKIALVWVAAIVLLAGSFGGGVLALNLTVFSPTGFVTSYLKTLGARDVAGVLEIPGVTLPDSGDLSAPTGALLVPDAMSSITSIHIDGDIDLGGGLHQVTASYTLGGAGRESTLAQSSFLVEPSGVTYGVFTQWKFTESPVATLSVAVKNSTSLTVGTHRLDASALGADAGSFGAGGRFTVLVPSLVVLGHHSHYLTSKTETVALTDPGQSTSGVVTAEPNTAFVDAVKTQLDSFLDDCTTHRVLFPPGCPFAKPIEDRIQGDPTWSIVEYPQISIMASPASWVLAQNVGTAHVTVVVKSLFDGTVSTLDEDVPFSLDYLITLEPDEAISFAQPTS